MTASTRVTSLLTLALLAAAAHAAEALAGEGSSQKRPRFVEACQEDAARLCPGVPPGGKVAASCLMDHRKELSADCRSALRRARQVASFRAACGADVARLCTGVAPGEGRVRECLRAGSATLAPACQKRLARAAKAAAPEAQAEAQVVEEAAQEQQQGGEPSVEAAPATGEEEGKEEP